MTIMGNKFIVLSRYETWTSCGKQFTKWFVINTEPLDKKKANEYIKNQKINFGFIDKKTKMKHEYKLQDYNEYCKEQEEFKKYVQDLNEKTEAYYKSDEFKQLQKKKRQAAKERKIRQEKYKKEHGL